MNKYKMASVSLSILPCSIILCVCLICSTLCQSLASLNSLNPFHMMKNAGLPIPSFLDDPFNELQKNQKQNFRNLKNINEKKK